MLFPEYFQIFNEIFQIKINSLQKLINGDADTTVSNDVNDVKKKYGVNVSLV